MLKPEQLVAMLKLVVTNTKEIDALFAIANDFACLIESKFERCSYKGCCEPVTVRHVNVRTSLCDSHAAISIVNAVKKLDDKNHDLVNEEESWIDVENASSIRKIRDYVLLIKRNDEPNLYEFDKLH